MLVRRGAWRAVATPLLVASIALVAAGMQVGIGASAKEFKKDVRFPRGAQGTTLTGSVVRGDRDVYVLRASAGQLLEAQITSVEDNAVFQIQAPDGLELAGARSGEDAKAWSGKLTRSGAYRIVVGGTRGNATYTLTVRIRASGAANTFGRREIGSFGG
jgi:hypothetical protein